MIEKDQKVLVKSSSENRKPIRGGYKWAKHIQRSLLAVEVVAHSEVLVRNRQLKV